MQTNLFIKTSFESVYFVNGVFLERPKTLIISRQGVTYITVLPLSSALLPYTVKLCGTSVRSNEQLCKCVKLTEDKYLLFLSPRYNYVYTAQGIPTKTEQDVPCRFFELIKKGDVVSARKLLTPSLSCNVDDDALTDFFGEYETILLDDGYVSGDKNNYLLIDKSGNFTSFTFVLSSSLIDDVKQNE